VNQEFRLQPILQKARSDLAESAAQSARGRVTAVFLTQFASYDFNKQSFPITLNLNQISFSQPCCNFAPGLPDIFIISVSGADAVDSLPMSTAAAQAFTEARTRSGNVNRAIAIAVTIKLGPEGFKINARQATATGTLESATIFGDQQATLPLYQISASDLETIRVRKAAAQALQAKAEAERQAGMRRQQMLAQRQQTILALTNSTASVKLANWLSTGELNINAQLDNLRSARVSALTSNKPVPVRMLVQAGASGRSQVDTNWPGKLQISVAEGPALTSSGWFLVQGLLSVSDEDTLPAAQLLAQTVYACKEPKCAEAEDAVAIVDRKLGELSGNK